MEDDGEQVIPIHRRMSPAPLSPLTSPPSTQRAHRTTRSAGSRFSTASSITTLPEYTTSPPPRMYGRSFSAMQEVWPPPLEDSDPLPDYKSPPAPRTYHQPRSSISKVGVGLDFPPPSSGDMESEPFVTQFTALSPRNRRVAHRRHTSSSTWKSTESADEELDSRLDQLVERSVAALEISNHLLSHSISSGRSESTVEHSRPVPSPRARRRERMGTHSHSGIGRRWVDEHIAEEDEEESAWEESTFTGSLPEQSYLSAAHRPQLPRMSSHSSLGRSPSEPSLDGYQFPRSQPPYGTAYQFPDRASPVPSISRSATRTPTRPAPLSVSSADLGAPQVSTPSFHPSTPAYKLVSEIVSREALQRRTPGSQASGSQPSTPQATTLGLPIPRASTGPSLTRRDSSADPPKHRRKGTLTASISVPQDIGKWIRSLEPRSSPRPVDPVTAPGPEVVSPVPQRPKIISPQLPPSPPHTAITMSTSPPSMGEEPVPLSRSISQLRAILSSQPAPEAPMAAPIPKRPQFRPMTPQVASTALTRPPPTPRSESTPPHGAAVETLASEDPLPSPVPSAMRKFRASRHDRHVSFSPTPTEIPSRATSPPPEDPTLPTTATSQSTGWSFINWLMPSQTRPNEKETKKQKKKREDDELAQLWRTRAWLQEGRQGWNERMSEAWQV